MPRGVKFEPGAWEDFLDWQQTDKKIYAKILSLIKECRRTPMEGEGKPEELRGNLSGWCSRRITAQHRLVYRANEDQIEIKSCMYHYDDH